VSRVKEWALRVGVWPRGLIRRPVTAGIIALGPVILGLALGVWPDEVAHDTQRFLVGPRGAVDWWVTAFWVGFLIWTWVLFLRLGSDDARDSQRFRELTSAIYRAPNAGIFKKYEAYYDEAASLLASATSAGNAQGDRARNLEFGIQAVLVLLAGLAREFTSAPAGTIYGANVMLIAAPDAKLADAFPESILSKMRFFDRATMKERSLRAVLYLAETLLMSDASSGRRVVPVIALPVPKSLTDGQGHKLALPGAPWALLSGKVSIYEDARLMPRDCGDFTKRVRDQIEAYFAPGGDGGAIRSLLSIRIGTELEPVGVLNIDCSETYLLGQEPEYYPTFYALLTPIVRLLVAPVREYAALAFPELSSLTAAPIAVTNGGVPGGRPRSGS
jgi:hypothetical protein